MKYILFFALLLFSVSTSSQIPFQQNQRFSEIILDKINNLRQELGVQPMQLDSSLYLAANFHSSYMSRVNRLSHNQSSRKYRTPILRVKKFSDEYKLVGENILSIEKTKKNLKDKLIIELADQMFNLWKNSPGHYANMIKPDYELCGFGFGRNKNGTLYAANVFGTKGIKIKGQLSKNAFGIKEGNKDCDEFLSDKMNLLTYMGNNIQTYRDNVTMYFHNKSLLEKFFTGEKDGIAIDLINREQFACDAENMIDMSAIYDGILLKPVYRGEIFNNNSSENDYRLISNIGKIPEELANKTIKPSLIYLKDGKKCSYNVPCNIPSDEYQLAPVEPKFKNFNAHPFYQKGIVSSQTLYYDFERGFSTPTERVAANKIKGTPSQISICSYSSIEGDSAINIRLQKERAAYIQNHIYQNYPNTNSIKANIFTKENWETTYYQLELLRLNHIATLPKEKIKAFIEADQINNWDSLLFIQRRSYATIDYEGTLNAKDSLFYEQNLLTAIQKKNWNVANRAMEQMYKHCQLGIELFSPGIFEVLTQQPELVQNASALLSQCFYYDAEGCVLFLRHWINHQVQLDADAQYNLCILYCMVVDYIFSDWDVSTEVITNVIHPSKVLSMINSFQGLETHGVLILNFHLTAINYYGQINDYAGISRSFKFITNYFQKMALNMEDEIKLCLFYNRWSRFDLTIDNLLKRMSQKDFNEEAAFILAQTILAYPHRNTEDEILKAVQLAIRKNKKRWCKWINEDFQYLRSEAVKSIYCKECEVK